MEPTEFIRRIKQDMNCSLRLNYSKTKLLTVRERYKNLAHTFENILNSAELFYHSEAREYCQQRSKKDKELKKIQDDTQREIVSCIKEVDCFGRHKIDFDVVPASSFSAKTHLIGDSDIDFAIMVKKLDRHKVVCISNALGLCEFIYNDLRNKDDEKHIHWVFQKYIDDVEIEGKVRDMNGFKEILKMHHYVDHEASKKDKELVTYIKYLLKQQDSKAYELFKQFYYCWAGYHGKCNELMYPLLK